MNTINENKVTKIIVDPTGEEAKRILNSLCKVVKILNHNNDHREGIIQYKTGMNINPAKVETQFKESPITEDKGSNTENKLVITFNQLWGMSF